MQVYCWICLLWHQHNKFQTLYRWCTIVSATSKCAEPQVENVAQGSSPSVTFPTEGHHIWLSSDQLRAASLIARNAVTWLWALLNNARFTTIYHRTFSRKVKMSEDWSSDIFTFGFARWRFNLFECRRRMLQRHLPNGVERMKLRSPDCW